MKPILKKLTLRKSPQGNEPTQAKERVCQVPSSQVENVSGPALSESISSPYNGQHGLVLLNAESFRQVESGSDYTVDIVAIHGLGGGIRSTWTHKKSGVFWLKDLLPNSIPGARIFSYGYPSDIFLSRSTGQIRHYARNLLSSLQAVRREKTDYRPIIYICHSLGGIVFKQAMNVAYDQYYSVWEWSKGVVFLGTPHRGSTVADLGTILGNIGNAVWSATGSHRWKVAISTSLLHALKSNSNELNDINEVFIQRASALSIETFFETYLTQPVGTLIVEESSAMLGLPHERWTPLYADHRDLCRFENQLCENYKLILDALLRMVKEVGKELPAPPSSINSMRSLDQVEKQCVHLLNTTDTAAYESRLDRSSSGTLDWVKRDPQYLTWQLSNESRLLLVTGDAGCGKTTLSSYVIQCLSDVQAPRPLLCRFYCSGQIEAHRDASSIMRSILFQIVRQRKRLIQVVRKASDLQGTHLFNRFDALWDLLVEILYQEATSPITIVIDGIDECDDIVQKMIVDRIVDLLKSTTLLSVKFLLTSRPSSTAVYTLEQNLSSYVRLSLEEKQNEITQDVNLVIRQRMETMVRTGKCEPQTRLVLEEMLMRNADRTFLWVSLVFPLLEQRRHLESVDLPNIVMQLPENLSNLYQSFLNSIPADDRLLAGKLLRILATAARPLNIDEIRSFLIIGSSHHTISALEAEPGIGRLESIRMLLGPLIRISGSRVYLVHQSLKDFLLHLSAIPSHPLAGHFGVNLQHETLMLVQSCVQYLSFNDFEGDMFSHGFALEGESPESPSSLSDWQDREKDDTFEVSSFDLFNEPIFKEQHVLDAEFCVSISNHYHLYDYAALHWAAQFAQCSERPSNKVHDAVISFFFGPTYCLSNWFRYFWAVNLPNEPFPERVGGLTIAAFCGLVSIMEEILTATNYDVDEQVGPAIYWASRRGYDRCVKRLLRKADIPSEASYVNRQSPLLAACEHGHFRCTEILISSGRFDVNEQDLHGRSPLHLACVSGFDDILRLLLKQSDINVNLPDRNGACPLFSAVASNSDRTLSLLLGDQRVNPNWRDNLGRSALLWAAAEGYYTSTKILLKDPRVDAASKDARGRTALSLAAQLGHLGIVQLLARSGGLGKILELDNDRRNAISWAAQQPQPTILHYLVKHGREGADVEDRWGWTPLSWALNPPGYPDNVSVLIQSGYINVNRKDEQGRSALSFAAGYGVTAVVRLLCRTKGIEFDSRDRDERTPLSHAAAAGNLEAIRILIETNGANINAQDKTGRTPLSWAASEGRIEVIEFLLISPGIEPNFTDKNGRTPLDFAKMFGKHDAVRLFEAAF